MNFWYVYQGRSWRRALAGGYLWAPAQTKSGGSPFYFWTAVSQVRETDLIFCHYKTQVVAVATPLRLPYRSSPPDPTDEPAWPRDGWRLDVEYQILDKPLSFNRVRELLSSVLPAEQSPIAPNGRPTQGYMFPLPETGGTRLCGEVYGIRSSNPSQTSDQSPPLPTSPERTSALSLVQTRIGQGAFRARLDEYWDGKCAISSAKTRALLRGSHTKPWAFSNNSERVDHFNGFLLNASYDSAFDKGLITFTQHGELVLAKSLATDEAELAGINPDARLRKIAPEHWPYLQFHRQHIFEKGEAAGVAGEAVLVSDYELPPPPEALDSDDDPADRA